MTGLTPPSTVAQCTRFVIIRDDLRVGLLGDVCEAYLFGVREVF